MSRHRLASVTNRRHDRIEQRRPSSDWRCGVVAGRWFRVAIGALGVGLTVLAAPVAVADPTAPVPLPVPDPAPVEDAALSPAPATPAAPVVAGLNAPVPAGDPALTPPDDVQHLPSPDSLPPGTTQEPPTNPKAGLLRDIWNALRDGDMSGPDAIRLLAIRPVDPEQLAGSKPSNQSGPDVPTAPPVLPPDAAPAPAPAAAPAPAPDAPVTIVPAPPVNAVPVPTPVPTP
jgi:hypothetical protein